MIRCAYLLSTDTLPPISPAIGSSASMRCHYRLNPSFNGNEYVVVSGSSMISAFFKISETYIFSADENGMITDWFELEGSFHGEFKGAIDQATALDGMGKGYIIK